MSSFLIAMVAVQGEVREGVFAALAPRVKVLQGGDEEEFALRAFQKTFVLTELPSFFEQDEGQSELDVAVRTPPAAPLEQGEEKMFFPVLIHAVPPSSSIIMSASC